MLVPELLVFAVVGDDRREGLDGRLRVSFEVDFGWATD